MVRVRELKKGTFAHLCLLLVQLQVSFPNANSNLSVAAVIIAAPPISDAVDYDGLFPAAQLYPARPAPNGAHSLVEIHLPSLLSPCQRLPL